MDQSRARYLILGLLGNKLSGEELDEVLCGLENQAIADEFSNVLKQYFDRLTSEGRSLTIETKSDIFKDNP